jgi:UDP-glucose 4-epimerase
MGLCNLKLKFTGGVDGGSGWKGDVKSMQLSVNKLQSLGWKPTLNSEEAIRLSCRELLRSRDKSIS